ncbi:M48 family metalloprotease [Chryseobacterium caseinilyticum]|uniref:M48 family metalloprotease n=1 Tax=Chryseobacterium caseinilyticum TaxID=2771428 RepID=A0ABR8ZF35_9FLAO|nr:M48 family metallopeptidase [Chryseobacterium caseinilyticum]MBD8083919.1 M48 family metalloprotease [Chryseobacterium caseinilyticum]
MYIEVSDDFKKKSAAAVWAIVIFVIVYLFIFVLAIALALACIAAGIWLIVAKPMLVTIMLGAGMAGLGLFVFYFVIKFLFKRHINDRSDLKEIKRESEPELFKMIDEIVKEAGTNSPKKVYLSHEVNASVFYDSSFWSMFLPIQKNLTIGMGLVNTTTKQELKAILAHEFGHFSQRSMKVGSYVYNVNQIIFNLVNDDESYRDSIRSFSDVSGYFSVFGALALFITGQIQWVLVKMYSFVNLRHMALSREMEFHADEVAAHIAGSLPLEESLLRLELAENSYQNVLHFYDSKFSTNVASKNIYQEQSLVMAFLAEQNEVLFKNGLPDIKLSESGLFSKSKLNIENQWASHPSHEDRIERLRKLNIVKENFTESAKDLFTDFTETEEKMTLELFSKVNYKDQTTNLDIEIFRSEFEEKYRQDSFDRMFNSYYDHKNPDITVKETSVDQYISFDELFSKEKVEWVYSLITLENDFKTVEAISKKEIDIKTFDYDGIKYKQKDAKNLLPEIQIEIDDIKEKVLKNDSDIYNYYIKISEEKGQKVNFINTYKDFADYDKVYEEKYQLYLDLLNETNFMSNVTPFEQIKKNFQNLKTLEEKLKFELTVFHQNAVLTKNIDHKDLEDLKFFTSNNHIYFLNNQYMERDIQLLVKAINYLPYFLRQKYFLKKKALLGLMQELREV